MKIFDKDRNYTSEYIEWELGELENALSGSILALGDAKETPQQQNILNMLRELKVAVVQYGDIK